MVVYNLKAVLFDLDGTLVDTAPDFVLAANALRAEYNLEPMHEAVISEQVSNGAYAVVKTCLHLEGDQQTLASYRQELLVHYAKYLGQQATLYAGLEDLLLHLDGINIPWGIVTNKPLEYAAPLINKLGLNKQCSTLVCPDHVQNSKPDPEALFYAANQLNVEPAQCLYIGDHQRDILAGAAAGMTTIAVGYGYLSEEQNIADWQADHTAATPQAVYSIICNMLS